VGNRSELSREVSPGEHASFFDIPRSALAGISIARLPDCRILLGPDPWGNEQFAVVTPGDRQLLVPGLGFLAAHVAPLRRPADRALTQAVWVMYRHARNHFHWLVNTLTRVLVALQAPDRGPMILLPRERLTPAMAFSIEALGIRNALYWEGGSWRVADLTVVEADAYTPSLIGQVRTRLVAAAGAAPRSRRVFVSRAAAKWRRLVNEEAAWPVLRSFGYERVQMEALDFPSQVRVMAESVAVAGVHGAGMANTLFCPPGAQVLEISDPGRASPIIYALAGAAGHDYWLLHGRPEGTSAPKYRNLSIDVAALERTLEAIEQDLRARP
jgi:capsular polysaccharide biosynthesis protein